MTNFENQHHRHHATETGDTSHHAFHAQFQSMGHYDISSSFNHDHARSSEHLHHKGILPGFEITGDTNHHKHHGHVQHQPAEHHGHHLHHGHHEHQGHHGHHEHQGHHGHHGHHGGVDGAERGGSKEDRPERGRREGNEGDLSKVSNDGSNMSKEDKEKYLYQRLTAKDGLNLTDKQAAGAIGSLEGESPDLYSGRVNHKHEHDLGFVNWIGPRRRELEHFAKEQGKEPTDFKTQVAFMEKELKGSENRALEALKHTNSVKAAATAFTRRYERPGIPHLQHRIDNAELAYERANRRGWHDSRAEDNQQTA